MEVPGRWPEVRAELWTQRAATEGVEASIGNWPQLDPVAAAKMEPTNVRRVVRALEVTVGSGRPFSSFGPGVDTYPPVPFEQFGLRWPRPIAGRRVSPSVFTE